MKGKKIKDMVDISNIYLKIFQAKINSTIYIERERAQNSLGTADTQTTFWGKTTKTIYLWVFWGPIGRR